MRCRVGDEVDHVPSLQKVERRVTSAITGGVTAHDDRLHAVVEVAFDRAESAEVDLGDGRSVGSLHVQFGDRGTIN